MKHAFIINPNSGKDRNKTALVNQLTKRADDTKILFTEYPGHAAKLVWKMLDWGAKTIVAAGGDGTINEVASQLVGKEIKFGIIPMGSGNGYARSLKIPLNIKNAVSLIYYGNVKSVDVGSLNDSFFFATAGVGLDATIGKQFHLYHKRGALPYFYLGVKAFFKYDYPEFSIKSKERKMSIKPTMITIANANQFGNGALIAPQADLQDGLLDICVLEKMKKISAVFSVMKLFNGKIQTINEYQSFKTDCLEILSNKSEIDYHIDGEPHSTRENIRIGILEKSLQVISPE